MIWVILTQLDLIFSSDDSNQSPSNIVIRRCSFELSLIIWLDNNDHVTLENVFFRSITDTALTIELGHGLGIGGTALLQNVTFANNTYYGTSIVDAEVVEIIQIQNVTFIDCEFYNNLGTPISA